MKKIVYLLAVFLVFMGCQKVDNTKDATDSESDINSNNTEMIFYQIDPPQTGEKIAIMQTSKGEISIRLFESKVPKTVENFIGLAEKGYYDGVIFHRVIADFMVQGGDPTGTGMGGESLWGDKFEDEFDPDLKNLRGAFSMANAGPNTNGSQFFIIQKEGGTAWLDGKHSVFGQVFEGMDIVDQITMVETDPTDKPLEEIVIESITIKTQ